MELYFYMIDSGYLDYLRRFEPRVPLIKENRPFLGIILKVNYRNYFAPLASPKEKHKRMHQQIDIIKMEEGTLGVINLNDMIPVPESRCIKMEWSKIEDEKYQILLRKQLVWCNQNRKFIVETANKLYESICYASGESNHLKNRCCDFKLLERKCIAYMKRNTLREEEFFYQIS